MAKTRTQKEFEVRSVVEGLKGATAVVFADMANLKVEHSTKFRRAAEKDQVKIRSVKRTLLRQALKEAGLDAVPADQLAGSVSVLFGAGDQVAPAKAAAAFRKEQESVKILGGVMDGTWMSADQVKALATLPSKQELLAKIVGSLNAPVSGFVNVLAGNLRGLVNALNAIKASKAS